MPQKWKIVIAVVITAIVVGGGVYLWQNNKGEELPAANSKSLEENSQAAVTGIKCNFSYQCENKINCKPELIEGCANNTCQCLPELDAPVQDEPCASDSWCQKGFADCADNYRPACVQGVCDCKLK